MSNINNRTSTLVYNGGSFKFRDTSVNFKNFKITFKNNVTKTISQILDLSSLEPTNYTLLYKKDLDEYKIKDFFFFYENVVEDELFDVSALNVDDDAKTFLVFIDINEGKNLNLIGAYQYRGERPYFESGGKYLVLIEKVDGLGLVLEIIAKNVKTMEEALSLTFLIKNDGDELNLNATFPKNIYGFTPGYKGKIKWGDSEDDEYKFDNYTNLIHKYEKAGEYTVTIKGVCEGMGQAPSTCIKCSNAKGVKYFGKCFSYCTKFCEYPDDFFHSIGPQEELNGCFQGTFISKISENLFPKNKNIKRIVSLFSECVNLNDVNSEESVIPEKIFSPLENLEELISVFDSSFYITKVPKNIFKYNPKLKNIDRCFAILGLDKGSIDIDLTPSQQVINNIPDGIVDGLNIKRTESVFSGLGLGRLLRHVDDRNNPHEVTLQQAYDDSYVLTEDEGGPFVKVTVRDGLMLGTRTPEDTILMNKIDIANDRTSIESSYGDKIIGFSTGFHQYVHGEPSNEVFGAPLRIEDGVEEFHAVTLKQLREAELNHIELKGEWNPNNGDDGLDKASGSCYYVNSDGSFFDIKWNVGDFLLFDSSSRAIKMEGDVTFKDVFESTSENDAVLNTTKSITSKDSKTILKITGDINESVQLGHSSGVSLALSNGKVEVCGGQPLTLSANPVSDLDAVTKKFLSDSFESLKTGANDGSFAIEWSGNNYFSGGLDVGYFQFSKFNESIQELGSTYPVSEYRIRLENDGAKNIISTKETGISVSEMSYNKGHTMFPTTKMETVVSDGVYINNVTIESGTGATHSIVASEKTSYARSGERFKKFTGNVEVSTDKTGWENFKDNEFVTKSSVNEGIGNLLEEHLKEFEAHKEEFEAHKESISHVNILESDENYTLYGSLTPDNKAAIKASTFRTSGFNYSNNDEVKGSSYSRWKINSISFAAPNLSHLQERINQNGNNNDTYQYNYDVESSSYVGRLLYLHVYKFDAETNSWSYVTRSSEAKAWIVPDKDYNGAIEDKYFQTWPLKDNIIVGSDDKIWTIFLPVIAQPSDKNVGIQYLIPTIPTTSPETSGFFSVYTSSGANIYTYAPIIKVDATPLASLTAQNKIIATIDDIDSKIDSSVMRTFFKVGYVYSTTIQSPPDWPSDDEWTLIGTTTIGTKTVYHYERTL